MTVRRAAAVLLAAALAFPLSSCSVFDAPLPGGPDPGKDPILVTARFRDVLDLVPQSNVKLNDVTIGKVSKVQLDGYVAKVTLELPRNVSLPDNVRADIRQTSLLGEKFVSLSKPAQPEGTLGSGDTIGLDQTGRNPEVEEVLSALSALLSGGGVAQLKTISHELNNALGGREEEVRAVVRQLGDFMGQLDQNKSAIVSALENLNRLSLQLRREDPTIKQTLDKIPAALASIDRQRDDLIRMLRSLQRLSGVGVQVIRASKAGTIDSLKALSPVLAEFAKAGDDFPKALSSFLTYPFIDESVGRDPQVARNLQMGDFVNLSARLDLDLGNLPGLPGLPGPETLNGLIQQCQGSQAAPLCNTLAGILGPLLSLPGGTSPTPTTPGTTTPTPGTTSPLPSLPSLPALRPGSTSSQPSSGSPLSTVLSNLGLPRPLTGFDATPDPFHLGIRGVDPSVGTLLLQGVAYQ